MLYNNKLPASNETFIFPAVPYNEDINLKDIAALEGFYQKKHYIPQEYIPLFLNYITYYVRSKCSFNAINPLTTSFKNQCGIAAHLNYNLLTKMGFKIKEINIGDIFNTAPFHQICTVEIPTLINNELTIKEYTLDPTFRQFCLTDENRFARYNEEPKYSVKKATPHPGYFLNLTKIGQQFANRLISLGYFENTPENLKIYFDSFALFLTDKEKYSNKNDIGKISKTPIAGTKYQELLKKDYHKDYHDDSYEVQTPLEEITIQKNKLKNRLKNFFTHKNEFSSNINLEDEDSSLKM